MNYPLVLKMIGNMMKIEAAFMLAPLAVALIYGDGGWTAFVWPIVILAGTGFALSIIKPEDKRFATKDAFAAAALSWLVFSVFGALPFYFSGCFNGFVDCLFESVSGFTTTGATILAEIESLPHGILFWRSFTHWIGGMGVIVFMLAIIPSMNASSINLMRAESTGPSPGKVVPRVRETARIMYLIYLAMTVVLVILLCVSGLPLFDALIHGFSTAGTGGFSNMNASVSAYGNAAVEIIITVFMFLFGVSFTVYFLLIKRNFKQALKDEELRFFFGIVIFSILLITANITGIYGTFGEALRYASFQVSSVISTTGFYTADYNLWPALSQSVIVILMLTGCCAGSTGGGIKLVRILLLFKAVKIEINKIVHPQSVKTITLNGKKTEDETVTRIAVFFFIYVTVCFIATAVVSVEGKDVLSNLTAVISMLSNVGPGLGIAGPTGNFSGYTALSKVVLTFCMVAGRLEFLPVFVLLKPSVWRKV